MFNNLLINKTFKKKIVRLYHILISKLFYSWRFNSFGSRSILVKPDLLFNEDNIFIGNYVEIRKGARLEVFPEAGTANAKIEIGDGTSIHLYFHCGAASSVIIGKNVLIAGKVFITDHDHVYDNVHLPCTQSGLNTAPVIIEDEVWIGEGAAILKGVTIGKRSVIGANAVVTKSVPPYTVVGGIPARFIKRIG